MNIGEYSVKNKVVSWLIIIILVGGGLSGYESMGKLEDPAFTIKLAKVITYYPGASAQQVQDEVTYHIEEAIQKMGQLKRIKMSISRPGMSDIEIEFKDQYVTKDFPDIYDELRRKIKDMQHKLPPGAQTPIIIDEFADVYGLYVTLTGLGYTYRDIKDYADALKKQLVLVPGVRKIEIGGEQQEMVYVEISRARLGELGISLERIEDILKSQNIVVDAGRVRIADDYIRIDPTGDFTSVKAIGDVLIGSEDKKLIYLKDIADIKRTYKEVPDKMFYIDGERALTLTLSMLSGENVVAVGERLTKRIDELKEIAPVGMEITVIYNQPLEVANSVNSFIINVIEALVIVIVVLLLFMGLKTGLIIGAVLLITVAGTLWIMSMFGIELQRVSLGALIIALGMLVDNGIVVAENMLVRIKSGMNPVQAAGESVGPVAVALLGGTAIGILAFSAIGLAQSQTGEFARSLFLVILISLSLSWLTAVSSTPLLCALFLKPDKNAGGSKDPYSGAVFRIFRGFVKGAIQFRWVTVAVVVALFLVAVWGFGFVKQSFFPNAKTPMFFVDVWEIEGTDIRKTRDDTLKISRFLREQKGVVQTTSVIGGGHSRFSLVYAPKEDSPVYAQIIVQVDNRDKISALGKKVAQYMADEMPHIDPLVKFLRIGPGRDSKIEARFHGPDPGVLRELSEQAQGVFRADPEAKDIRDDWRQPVKRIVPVFNEQVGRELGITRGDLGAALKFAFEGKQVGLYRDGIRLLPILLRSPKDERQDVTHIQDIQVWSPVLQQAVPLGQVVSGFETVWENTVIRGRNRIQTIIASCNTKGELATALFDRVRPKIEGMELPPGYTLSWGGEYEDAFEAQDALNKALPMGFLLMIIATVLLFGKVRQPLIIWLTVPLAIIGITAGMLALNGQFDFMALLGALSLIGLLIKNAIVLIEEIDKEIAQGKESFQAILDSTVSRLRPVGLAAATTILGMIPLLQDAFFVNMSIIIMGGLLFATVLTLVIIPVLYSILFRIPYSEQA